MVTFAQWLAAGNARRFASVEDAHAAYVESTKATAATAQAVGAARCGVCSREMQGGELIASDGTAHITCPAPAKRRRAKQTFSTGR